MHGIVGNLKVETKTGLVIVSGGDVSKKEMKYFASQKSEELFQRPKTLKLILL